MAPKFSREIEVRCSTPGCTAKTTAAATPIDGKGGYQTMAPRAPGWVASQHGRETGAGDTWMYATCPEHAALKK
jgi:hypothetical protein